MPNQEKTNMIARKTSLTCIVLCTSFACIFWGQAAPKTSATSPPTQIKKKVAPRKVPLCEIKASRSKVPAGGLVTLRVIHPKPKGTKFTYDWSITAGSYTGNLKPAITLNTKGVPPGHVVVTIEIRADTDAPFGSDRHKTCSYAFEVVRPGKDATKPKPHAGKR
jgi:hypothetical protein